MLSVLTPPGNVGARSDRHSRKVEPAAAGLGRHGVGEHLHGRPPPISKHDELHTGVVKMLNGLCMHEYGTIICMRTTLIIDDELLERAREATGIQEKTALVRAGLEALIAREAGKRLAALGGSQPKLTDIPRRRSA